MLPLTGYADRLSLRPGETVRFHVANATGEKVTCRIVRVISADPNPAGLGIRTEPVAGPAGEDCTDVSVPQDQKLNRGSFAVVHDEKVLAGLSSVTLLATVCPTSVAGTEHCILSMVDQSRGGVRLSIDRRGHLVCAIGVTGSARGNGWRRIETSVATRSQHWQHIWMSFDRATGEVTLGVQPLERGEPRATPHVVTVRMPEANAIGQATFLIGASTETCEDPSRFNGRIERPMIFDHALSLADIDCAQRGERVAGLIAAWDFSLEMQSSRIVDTGPHALHGTLVNAPTRAVRGANWTGREPCYRHAREHYGAIHFHDDDIDDCRWPVTHEYTVPQGLKSGAYALILTAGAAEDNIPFFVVPPKGQPAAKLAVLVSTFTYTVYGNHARPEWTADPKWRAAWEQQTKDWKAYPHNPGAHPEYGLSTYNNHTDGSGIALASWHRPMFNLRIGYVTYPYPAIRGSGLRHYPADSHLLAWLESKGHAYDLITDWELHHEGAGVLQAYTCVMTGSHPEYHTGAMLDALETYRDGGGRFIYLGGNGFYWKIALSPDKPGLIEIRRAEGGIRAWAAEPGEYYNQFDGEYGGLWRRNGRPPQQLVGVGFTAQGNFVGSPYRIKTEARTDPRTAWMFSGITSETIGAFGLSGHGAAGFELDRADKRLGTPTHAVVVAQSENHPPEAPWVLVPEEQLTHLTTLPGQSHAQLIRADMTFFETANNGAVFSTGSITFCGSLPHNGFDNDISTLVGNVLCRFLDPAAIFEPGDGRDGDRDTILFPQ